MERYLENCGSKLERNIKDDKNYFYDHRSKRKSFGLLYQQKRDFSGGGVKKAIILKVFLKTSNINKNKINANNKRKW